MVFVVPAQTQDTFARVIRNRHVAVHVGNTCSYVSQKTFLSIIFSLFSQSISSPAALVMPQPFREIVLTLVLCRCRVMSIVYVLMYFRSYFTALPCYRQTSSLRMYALQDGLLTKSHAFKDEALVGNKGRRIIESDRSVAGLKSDITVSATDRRRFLPDTSKN